MEAKKEAEAQAEAEALHDTDVSGLARKDDFDETAYEDRILRENECGTVVSGTEASLDENTVLITEGEPELLSYPEWDHNYETIKA